jgi:DNA-binding HxlR family transcriptional regulator
MYDYGEACPISRASSVLCERWTLQIIREMMLGVTRFSEFQKYLPKISPSLLNARLRLLDEEGIILRKRIPEQRGFEYRLTAAGKALQPVLAELGKWGMRWVYDSLEDDQLDAAVLVRDIAVFLKSEELPAGDTVIQFTFTDLEETPKRYIFVQDDKREMCDENSGHEVDIFFRSTLRTLSEIWWGDIELRTACNSGSLQVVGPSVYTKNLSKWFPISSVAGENTRCSVEARPASS